MQNNVISAGGGDSGPPYSTDVFFKGRCTNSRGKYFQSVPTNYGVSEDLSLKQCFEKCIKVETDGTDVTVTGITWVPGGIFCNCEIDTGIGPVTGAFNGGRDSTVACYPNQVCPCPSLILQHLILNLFLILLPP